MRVLHCSARNPPPGAAPGLAGEPAAQGSLARPPGTSWRPGTALSSPDLPRMQQQRGGVVVAREAVCGGWMLEAGE